MRPRLTHSSRPRILLAAAILASLVASSAEADKAPPVYKPPARPGTRPPKEFVSDTAVVARVEDRVIRVHDYIDRFYGSYAEYRPRPDSAGRAEFLETLVSKEVLANVAKKQKRPETFEERAILKAADQRILGNILFERSILDSIQVTEAEVESVYAQMKRELHFGAVRFGSLQTAEKMRKDLLAGRISWARAWELRLRIPSDTSHTWDLGWRKRSDVPVNLAPVLFSLPKGAISPPIPEPPGVSLYTVRDERPLNIQGIETFRGAIIDDLRALQAAARREKLMERLRNEVGLQLDSAAVAWTAAQFPQKFKGGGTSNVIIDISVPDISPADTSRVIATYRDGKVTVGRIFNVYVSIDDMMRPDLGNEQGVREEVDLLVLEPRLAEIARSRGLDKDSSAVEQMALRREQLMVEHLYQDSIQAKVFIPPADRRKYYKENQHRFVTDASCVYALFRLPNKREADSLMARLRRGVTAREILRADSLAGVKRGRIETQYLSQTGAMFHKRLFQELKEGEAFPYGPDAAGTYNVVQLIHRDFGRNVPFEEADRQIDEYLQQEATDKLLAEFVDRHKQGMRVESHPELLMRIKLEAPK